MTEQHYIEAIEGRWPTGLSGCEELLKVTTAAVQAFPNSAKLWLLHGRLMFCTCEDCECVPEVIRCFQRAIDLDPTCADAHEELAQVYDGFQDQPDNAEPHYAKAQELRRTTRK